MTTETALRVAKMTDAELSSYLAHEGRDDSVWEMLAERGEALRVLAGGVKRLNEELEDAHFVRTKIEHAPCRAIAEKLQLERDALRRRMGEIHALAQPPTLDIVDLALNRIRDLSRPTKGDAT